MAFQDLFPEVAALLDGLSQRRRSTARCSASIGSCVRDAARIVALGETMRQRLIENKGAPPERTIDHSQLGRHDGDRPGPEATTRSRSAHGLADKFVVMHSGNIGLSQSLETSSTPPRCLRDVPDLQVVFQGEGVKKADLQAQARSARPDERHVPAVRAEGRAGRVVRRGGRLHRLAAARAGRLHRAEQALRHSGRGPAVHRGRRSRLRGGGDDSQHTTAASSPSRATPRDLADQMLRASIAIAS